MSQEAVIAVIAVALIITAPINAFIVWHGWLMNRSVAPRSPVLRALLWVTFSIWLVNLYFAVVGFRFLFDLEPVLPFGGLGLGIVILFILSVPAVVHWQMRRFIGDEQDRLDAEHHVGQ